MNFAELAEVHESAAHRYAQDPRRVLWEWLLAADAWERAADRAETFEERHRCLQRYVAAARQVGPAGDRFADAADARAREPQPTQPRGEA